MKDIFDKNGYLSKVHTGYEFREEQLLMADFLTECLIDQENAVIEAGTGIGKTLAYLLPSVLYGIENEKIIAVSTETKALQKQLIEKDIPIASEIIRKYFNADFKFSLCLGSANYPCRRRFEAFVSGGKIEPGDEDIIKQLKILFVSKNNFSRFDISVSNRIWNEIYRDSEACNSNKCLFSRNCVFQKARKEWASSNLLIMNHYLFFSNIITGKSYLPKFDVIIFDEAHSLEDIASDQLGFTESYAGIKETIDRLYKETRKSSLINRIKDKKIRDDGINLIINIIKELSDFFEKLRALFRENKYSYRIREPLDSGKSLLKYLKEILFILEKTKDDFKEEAINAEYEILRSRIFTFQQNLESLIYMQNPDTVYWIEMDENELLGEIYLMGKPMDVSAVIDNNVNMFYDSSVFISATLAAQKDFTYIADRLGINGYRSLLLNSPFDYKKQVSLFLQKNNSNPDTPDYVEKAMETANRIIEITDGNCLLLFTSYRMMESAKRILANLTGRNIHSQGGRPANETVNEYIRDNGSILMGTHSFWQGIDLPGSLLKGVIMMRLPFSVPDRPLVQARIERLVDAGINPFSSYQIPNAVIKFRQGFGRLIRSRADHGIIAVLDPRILNKSYGKIFLNSVPECSYAYSIDELEEFYADKKSINV